MPGCWRKVLRVMGYDVKGSAVIRVSEATKTVFNDGSLGTRLSQGDEWAWFSTLDWSS